MVSKTRPALFGALDNCSTTDFGPFFDAVDAVVDAVPLMVVRPVVEVERDQFSVCLIPETLSRTTLGNTTQTNCVNLEFDHQTKVIVESIKHLLPKFLEKII